MAHALRTTQTQVRDELRRDLLAARTSGRVVFLHAPGSAELSAFVRVFAEEARANHTGLGVAIGDAADPGSSAWRQIAMRLTGAQRARSAVRGSVAEWASVIPVIGPILSAILGTIDEIRGGARLPAAALTGSAIEEVRTLLTHGADRHRMIVLENLDAGDGSELSGAAFLIPALVKTRTLLLVTFSDPRGPTIDLCREAERLGAGRRLVLSTPTQHGLDDVSRRLLAVAAVLGPRFSTIQLAVAAGLSHDVVEKHAALLAGGRGFRLADTTEVDSELVDIYELA